ncbi:MAG: hypothetical protein COV07_03795 [Candidatus Vogelbacteria bacterium CG10_big_fil_rev_8_21_14_0_10_45_14]|uniref:Type II toxin-antitoxin system HicA family toxin n=1 Tax=Candidatus Vogelbacteria bacterium CG10_big_fil_rev_8_21_14_0_10_45_14 TaxID=1975042 RepID=A0A2H0RIY4_9BACT|nr:MAG: hypothetical protein COV07_03795 [Candidatus Vogelbacteria bacterium CG10_big_fil_rev_8_21_14_0_10_45_14]
MPRPIKLSLVLKTLRKNGFVLVSQRGSHAKFRKIGNQTKTTIIKTSKKEIPLGTFKSILELSGLNEEDFRNDK